MLTIILSNYHKLANFARLELHFEQLNNKNLDENNTCSDGRSEQLIKGKYTVSYKVDSSNIYTFDEIFTLTFVVVNNVILAL